MIITKYIMLMNYPIHPAVSQELREPLAMTTPTPTLKKVPRLQHGQSPGRWENPNNQQRTLSRHPALFQLGAPFHICITSCQPHSVPVTAHLFGLHGPTPKFGPKAVTRWKMGHNLHKPLPSLTPSSNTGFPSFLSDSILPTPTGTEIYKISIT